MSDAHPEKWPIASVEFVEYPPAAAKDAANVFIQWKGTDVCLDFRCDCGDYGHFDGYFAYEIRCPSCGAVYVMPSTVILRRADDTTFRHTPIEPQMGDL